MRVFINGEVKEIIGETSLIKLLEQFDLPAARVAIEHNRTVVRRKDWENVKLVDGDKIEIVHFVGGG